MPTNEVKFVVTNERIKRTMAALEKNNISAYYAESSVAAAELAMSLIPKGCTIARGGSETLKECGILDRFRDGDYNFLDRSLPNLTKDEIEELYRRSFFADAYFTSANAITENGELYNVDGNANRVAAICYGPRKVIVLAGANKIVRNLNEAIERVKCEAAPCNAVRLNTDTPCQSLGKCVGSGRDATAGCAADKRMCCQYLITTFQRDKDRIHVILIPENLGY